MNIQRLLVLTIFALLSFSSSADFRTVMEVHEVELVYLTLPASVNGTLTFSDCNECEQTSIRATVGTRYAVNGRNVSLADFRRAVAGITNRSQQIIDVFHDLESDTVIAVEVKL
ncbi:MAG: hypothetical protein R3192_15920 [Woeseiaceae bacterium]|nr:hypothetical protein [Woeseiaceae bacterium]